MKFLPAFRQRFESLATQRITVGVTGFSRAGKTVFIGSLAQALMTQDAWRQRRGLGPLAKFGPFERGRVHSARIRDDVHSELPHFPFRQVRDSLLKRDSNWPEPTTGISRLVLDIDTVSRPGMWKALGDRIGLPNVGLGHVQLELVDYPGEWLVDLAMLDQTYEEWSRQTLARATSGLRKALSSEYLAQVELVPTDQSFDDEVSGGLAEAWARYLGAAAEQGLTLNQPGRLLRPDTMRHSPVLRLVPLGDKLHDSGLFKGMSARFDEYKRKVIGPFHKDHFARMDRQVILVDVLRALHAGESVFIEMIEALALTLRAFDYSKGGWLSRLPWVGKTTHVLFAATKADHVTRHDRVNLEQVLRRMLDSLDESRRLRSMAARHEVMALASVCATTDYETQKPPRREILFGRPAGEVETGQWDPGLLPLDVPPNWSEIHFQFYNFAPPCMPNASLEGFPAINLGRALDFLIGEDFQ
jgi:predicted YcjX-like family ATPase